MVEVGLFVDYYFMLRDLSFLPSPNDCSCVDFG